MEGKCLNIGWLFRAEYFVQSGAQDASPGRLREDLGVFHCLEDIGCKFVEDLSSGFPIVGHVTHDHWGWRVPLTKLVHKRGLCDTHIAKYYVAGICEFNSARRDQKTEKADSGLSFDGALLICDTCTV
jgi:hypothetical protein